MINKMKNIFILLPIMFIYIGSIYDQGVNINSANESLHYYDHKSQKLKLYNSRLAV